MSRSRDMDTLLGESHAGKSDRGNSRLFPVPGEFGWYQKNEGQIRQVKLFPQTGSAHEEEAGA